MVSTTAGLLGLILLLLCACLGLRLRKRCRRCNEGSGRLRRQLKAAGVRESELDACLARLADAGIDTWQQLVAVNPSPEELERCIGLRHGHAAALGVALAAALVGKPAPLWVSGGAATPSQARERAPGSPSRGEAGPASSAATEMVTVEISRTGVFEPREAVRTPPSSRRSLDAAMSAAAGPSEDSPPSPPPARQIGEAPSSSAADGHEQGGLRQAVSWLGE